MTMITTERLLLRPFTEADLPEFMAIQQDPQVNRFLPWFMPKNESEALQMLHIPCQTRKLGNSLPRGIGELAGHFYCDFC